ncbi:MAG: aminotransferase class IV [Gammaproteobacteria bacterium]
MAEPLPTAYLNGEFLPVETARISPLDRGFLFGDAVYEVIPVYRGRALLLDAHLARLGNSLQALSIGDPLQEKGWRQLVAELIRRNGDGDMGLYLQVSRGTDRGRDHAFPTTAIPATVFAMASPVPAPRADGLRAITMPDTRWGRCDIKATALLANVLSRQAASEAGADEAILTWQGEVTEGSSSSIILVEGQELIRRPNSEAILPGTTTDLVVELAREAGLPCREEPIGVERLHSADEVWLASAMRGVSAVVNIDGRDIGDGTPGSAWREVASRFEDYKYAD